MTGLIIGAILITVVLTFLFIWVTNKAYSRKWENESDEKRGQF